MPIETASPNSAGAELHRAEGRFYTGMALAASATAIAGFAPGIFDTNGRKEPLNWAVGLHGLLFSGWLALFLAQTLLVFNRRVAVHRLLGSVAAGLAFIMFVSGYFTIIEMARRGYDLSGDLIGDSGDPLMVMVFQLGDLLCFGLLVTLGILFRHRPDAHKRLMLLATVGALMPAALSHIIGHSPFLRSFHPSIILIPYSAFLFAGAVHDRIYRGRIHPISLWGASALWLWSNIRAAIIGPSDVWCAFATWLIG